MKTPKENSAGTDKLVYVKMDRSRRPNRNETPRLHVPHLHETKNDHTT